MNIIHSPRFAKSYKKLPLRIKLLAEQREEIFRKNPFDKRLKTHKLKGELSEFYSFSITYQHKIVFHFDNIGTHKIYR